MSNLTQSTQSTATVAPDWYNQYAQNQAQVAAQGLNNAKFVGATPLQQQAFSEVNNAATQYQPTLTSAGNIAFGGGLAIPKSSNCKSSG
jgi:hypothetical protein